MTSLDFDCPGCLELFDSKSKILPCCNQTLCFKCINLIINKFDLESKYECSLCQRFVEFPLKKDFPTNNQLLKLLSEKANNELKFQMNLLEVKSQDLNEAFVNGVRKIKNFCDFMRNDIDVITESTIDLIYKYRDQFEKEVNMYESETLDAFENKKDEKSNLEHLINSVDEFYKQINEEKNSIDLGDRLKRIKLAQCLEQKLKIERENLDNLIFNGKILQFNENPRLNSTILGCLTYDLKDVKIKYKELNFEMYQKIPFGKTISREKSVKCIIDEDRCVFILHTMSNLFLTCSKFECSKDRTSMSLIQSNVISANTMYFSKVKLFKLNNHLAVYTLKFNNYFYVDILDATNLSIILSINLGSLELEWISATHTHLFFLGIDSKILIYDWHGTEISPLYHFSSNFLSSIPLDAKQMDIYDNTFVFKFKNRILVLNRHDGKILNTLDLTNEVKENFLVDSINNRLLLLENNLKVLMDYSFDIDLVSYIKLNKFPDDLKMFLSKKSEYMFVSEKDFCVYLP
jgi:hypothetical protein